MGKRNLFFAAFFLIAFSVYGQSGGVISLDRAISGAALKIQNELPKDSTVIVYQFQSPDEKLSGYILAELFDRLVNAGKFTVLDRGAQAVIDDELKYQLETSAGMISDESLASLTKRIGAQAIVSGSLDDIGGEYHFRIKVIGTETTAALVSHTASVHKNDRRIRPIVSSPPGPGQKIGTGAVNLLFGLGSWLEGDLPGGLTLTAAWAAAAGLFVIEAAALDRDNPAAGLPGTMGFAVAGLGVVYGFVRPFIYKRSPGAPAALEHIQPRLVLTADGNTGACTAGLQLSCTVRF